MGAAEVVKQQSLNVRTFRPARPRTSEAAKHQQSTRPERHLDSARPALPHHHASASTAGQALLHMLHLTAAAFSHTSMPRAKEAL